MCICLEYAVAIKGVSCRYEVTSTKYTRKLSQELGLAGLASILLVRAHVRNKPVQDMVMIMTLLVLTLQGFGSLFMLLWTGVYV